MSSQSEGEFVYMNLKNVQPINLDVTGDSNMVLTNIEAQHNSSRLQLDFLDLP